MFSKKKSREVTLLEDFWKIEEITDSGILHFKDGRSSIIFKLRGVDPYFFSGSDMESLFQNWRSIVRLTPAEDVQVVYSKHTNFQELLDSKLKELSISNSPVARSLLLQNLNSLLGDIDPQNSKIFRSEIHWVYSQQFSTTETVALRTQMMESKSTEWEQRLQGAQLRTELLNRAQAIRSIFKSLHGAHHVGDDKIVEEWPAIEIFPSELKLQDTKFRALTLKTLPEKFSRMGMMVALTSIPATFDLSLRLVGQDSKALYDRLDRKRRVMFGLKNRKGAGDLAASAQFQELSDLLQRLSQNNDSLVQMGLVLGTRSSEANEFLQRWTIQEFLNAQTRMGFLELHEPYLRTFDAFLETIPSFKGFQSAEHTMLSSNATHFLPLYESAAGDDKPVATYRTVEGSVYSINPVSRKLANFNWLISGTSGSGKSFFTNSLLLQSQSLNPRVFIVDIGGSYAKLTAFLKGHYINFDAKAAFSLSPFFLPRSLDPVEESKRREHIQMVFWEMLRDGDRLPTIEEKAKLKAVLEPYFEAATLPERPVTQIRNTLQTSGEIRLALLLDRWCAPSLFGNFLDSTQTFDFDASVVTLDLKGLQDFPDLSRVVQFILCASLWAQLRRSADQFTFIVLDEVAFSLLKAQPAFVDELISTVRKYNAGVVVITQDLEKITSSGAGASILQNTQMKALLQQRGDPRNFAEPLQLNDVELDSIRRLGRKKGSYSDIFLMVDEERKILRYAPNMLEYLLSTSVPHENARLEERLAQKTGDYAQRLLAVVQDLSRPPSGLKPDAETGVKS